MRSLSFLIASGCLLASTYITPSEDHIVNNIYKIKKQIIGGKYEGARVQGVKVSTFGGLGGLHAVAAPMMVLVHDVWDEGPHVCGETQLFLIEFFDIYERGIGG